MLFYSQANVIARNVLHGNSDGISLSHSNVNTISSNTSSHSGTGIGVFEYSHDNLVEFNATDDSTGVTYAGHATATRPAETLSRGSPSAHPTTTPS